MELEELEGIFETLAATLTIWNDVAKQTEGLQLAGSETSTTIGVLMT